MLRRLFALACGCAVLGGVRAQPCRGAACVALSAADIGRARQDFDTLAQTAGPLAPQPRAAFVNLAINRRVDFADDSRFACTDLWLTPLETLALGRGDCEDFAIAKFFVLLAGGTDPGELRLLYALRRDPARPGRAMPHVVTLAGPPQADPLVLDNIDPTARPLSQRAELDPVFSFDRAHLWSGVCGPGQGDAVQRLRPWRELLLRCAEQQDAAPRTDIAAARARSLPRQPRVASRRST